MRRFISILLGAVLASTLFIFMGCGETSSPEPTPSKPTAGKPADLPQALPSTELLGVDGLPRPSLDRLEASAKQHIETLQQEAVDTLKDADPLDAAAVAEVWGKLGQVYLAYDFLAAAEAGLAQAEPRQPQDPRWTYYLGVVAQRQGQVDRAVMFLERALELHPNDTATLARLGDLALDGHRLDAAEAWFEQLLAADPSNAKALYGLGRIAQERLDPQAAVDYFERTLEAQGKADAVYHSLGLAYRDAGQLDRAKQALEDAGSTPVHFPDPRMEAVQQWMSGARIHLTQGGRERRAGRLDQAERHFRRAIELAPENPSGHHNLGAVLGLQGRHPEALPALERAIELDAGLIDAHFDLAMAYFHLQRSDQAIASLDRVVRLDPGDRVARRRRAALLHAQGQPLEARQGLQSLLSEDDQDTESRLLLAQVEASQGHDAEALSLFQAVAAAKPDALRAHQGILRIMMAKGRQSAARDHLESVLRASSSSPATEQFVQHFLARLLATSQDASIRDAPRALDLAQQVLDAAPSLRHGETLAMALAANGRFDQATALQLQLVQQGRQAGLPAAELQRLESVLEDYRKGRPVTAGR